MSVLSEILADKRSELDAARRRVPRDELQRRLADVAPARDFVGAIRRADPPALIAEVKRASPSRGIIRHEFDPVAIAKAYEENGAACVSVLTEERHFHGKLEHLTHVSGAIALPVMRKDFIIDEYQVLESRAAGADALLLIVAALKRADLAHLLAASKGLGMAAFVEVHDEADLAEALLSDARLIGINNRDLHVFRTTIETTLALAPHVPADRLLISESGIGCRADVLRLAAAGVRGVLIGEALMRAPDVGSKVHELLGTQPAA